MAGGETEILNLVAVQDVDPAITKITDSSTQTALYQFDQSSMKWEKTEIEGTFFVYKRSHSPHFGYIILNLLKKTNKVEPVTEITETHLQVPYLVYRCKSGDIYGIWFYDEEDCIRISKMITRLVHASAVTRNSWPICVPKSASQTRVKSMDGKSNNGDIISILVNAEIEFNRQKIMSAALRSVPSMKTDVSYVNRSSSEKCLIDEKSQLSVNDVSTRDCLQASNSSTAVTPMKRFLSSGTPGSKLSCSKQLFQNSLQDLSHGTPDPKPSCRRRLFENTPDPFSFDSSTFVFNQEAQAQFFKSRAFSLDSTSKQNILGEEHDSDVENISKLTRLIGGITFSDSHIPEQTSPTVMTPEMFEETVVVSSIPLRDLSCPKKPPETHNSPALPSCMCWKDQHASAMHQVVPPLGSTQTPSKTVYSSQDFQNSPGDFGKEFLSSKESNFPAENVLPCNDDPLISKEHLASSFMYLLHNDLDFLLKIHEAYISSLKARLSNVKK